MTEQLTLRASERSAFANVLATRGIRATPEAPFIIEHREALIYMLCLASELEHAIMCQYLYAAFSVKQTLDEAFCGRIASDRGELSEILTPVGASLNKFAASLASGGAGIAT